MRSYSYRLLNVFAETTFGGNPLCVFEQAAGLSDAEMQALALQFNLSETVFILPSDKATARMRIFTSATEMPFAGHPTLGAAHVASELFGQSQDSVTLECKAGVIAVRLAQDIWTFAALANGAPQVLSCELSGQQVARIFGLAEQDLLGEPVWINTGTDQLLIALKTVDAVRRAQPDGSQLMQWPPNSLGRRVAYLFAFDEVAQASAGRMRLISRYFFVKPGGGVNEDPGTGSACANLGGWWIADGRDLPASLAISQGEQVQRACQLYLDISAERQIKVGGKVREIGRGVINLP
ncbi:PhzF family phenazine biosynthesis protein [Undibacterium sp. Jales W-56]|uniref:PhzF family phenazine biosynthesis protein n=1 Tax=Undibacterium sp. Jales W-56 TaxID=2897325 RepID=UPI0021D3EB46|nr:PhzF family phenazine biosynthesis protein [Undibacterium sp. Jales W-56]MCU6433122.1 PhzF family phenazine biosynthesis protein [Undibacterium sp. Jales W-56]